jgi:hypothetical protein
VRVADLLAREPEPRVWLWEPYLPEGTLALVVAFMKVGKSTLIYALAVAVAQGRPFLASPTRGRGVLILAVEEHPRDVERRLRRFGARPEDPIHVHAAPLLHSPAEVEAIRRHILDHDIGLVILDTLARFWTVADENDNAAVGRAVSPLLDLARQTGAVVLLVHHERKSGGEDGRAIRGGSALFGLVDQALILERRQGGAATHRVLRALGRYDETPHEVVIELVTDVWRRLGTAAELDRAAYVAKVAGVLSDEPQTVEALAQAAGLPAKTVRETLAEFGEQVVQAGRGVKGNPCTYRAGPDSFPSRPHSIGKETNPPPVPVPSTREDDEVVEL